MRLVKDAQTIGDPIQDVEALGRVRFVMSRGRAIVPRN